MFHRIFFSFDLSFTAFGLFLCLQRPSTESARLLHGREVPRLSAGGRLREWVNLSKSKKTLGPQVLDGLIFEEDTEIQYMHTVIQKISDIIIYIYMYTHRLDGFWHYKKVGPRPC